MNYLQLNDYSRFDKEEQSLADFFGDGNFIPFYKKHLVRGKIQLTEDDFIAGKIDTMIFAMKQFGIEYEYNDYPECLQKYLHRSLWNCTLGEIRHKLFEDGYIDPVFIKPKNNLKRFTGFVIDCIDDLQNTEHASDNLELTCSDPVVWLSEYRVPVINGEIRDYCHYSGDSKIVLDKEIAKSIVKDFHHSPKAYCIDIGVLSTGETALIEVNDAFSVGQYSMSKELYAELLITRWNELKGNSKS